MAKLWAEKCKFAHGQPKSVKSPFKFTGQNVYASSKYRKNIKFKKIVMKWFKEKNYYDYEKGKCSKVCGHYTQVD